MTPKAEESVSVADSNSWTESNPLSTLAQEIMVDFARSGTRDAAWKCHDCHQQSFMAFVFCVETAGSSWGLVPKIE